MNSTMNKVMRQVSRLSVVVAVSMSGVASAQGPLIDTQQYQLAMLKPIWEQPLVPTGMPAASGGQNLRTSGAKGASLLARNMRFNVVGDIGFDVKYLTASLEPNVAGEPVNLDDPNQFKIRLHAGEVVVPRDALTALFNQQILAYGPRPLNNVDVSTTTDNLTARAGLRLWSWFPGIWLPAKLDGNISINEENQLVYAPKGVAAVGIPLGGLLRMLGIRLTWLLSLNREGANLVGNELILDHRKVFPPPAIEGDIAEATLDDEGLRLKIQANPKAKFTIPAELNKNGSYMWIQSGDVKLYDIVVTNAKVLIVPKSGELTFNLYEYRSEMAKAKLTMKHDGRITAVVP